MPYKFEGKPFCFCKTGHWNFDRDFIKSVDSFGSISILIPGLSVHEHGVSFHLFRSSLISLSSLLWFLVYKSFTSLVKFIPTYFILLEVIMCLVAQLCLTLCGPMDCSPPDSSVHGIFQARILEHSLLWGISLTQGSNPHPLHLLQMAGRFFTSSATWEALEVIGTAIFSLSIVTSRLFSMFHERMLNFVLCLFYQNDHMGYYIVISLPELSLHF